MKKVLLIALMGLGIAHANDVLMKQAFPSGGWGSCAKEKGYLNFSVIAQLEKMQGGAQLVDNKVNSDIMPCVQGNNPNFKANLQAACSAAGNVQSPTKDKLCSAGGAGGGSSAGDAPNPLFGIPYSKDIVFFRPGQEKGRAVLTAPGTNNKVCMVAYNQGSTQGSPGGSLMIFGQVVRENNNTLVCYASAGAGWTAYDFTKYADATFLVHAPKGGTWKKATELEDADYTKVNIGFKKEPENILDTGIGTLGGVPGLYLTDSSARGWYGNQNGVNTDQVQVFLPGGGGGSTDRSLVSPTANMQQLVSKAFPTSGFTSCNADRGKLDFNAVAQLEQSGFANLAQEEQKVMQCITQSNPNFVTSLKMACVNSAQNSETRTRICKLVGIGEAAASVSSSVSPSLLITQAFPSGGWGDCAKEKGALQFGVIAELEKTPEGNQLLNSKLPSIMSCLQGNNPNFKASLQSACAAAGNVKSATKDGLCGGKLPAATNINAMMAQAFPSGGLGSCAREKGSLNFPLIAQIEQLEGGKQLVSAKVASDIMPCNNASNPNFTANLQLACNAPTEFPSPTKDQLCGEKSVNANAGAIDPTALLAKAFPTSGFTACNAERGVLDFDAIAILEKNNPMSMVQGKTAVTQCIQDKNPNFVASLRTVCGKATQPSTTKTDLCGLIGATVGVGTGASSSELETRVATLEAKIQKLIDYVQSLYNAIKS